MPTISTDVNVDISFEVYCDNCNAGLCYSTRVRGNTVYVLPCQNCQQDKWKEGYDKGYEEGERRCDE